MCMYAHFAGAENGDQHVRAEGDCEIHPPLDNRTSRVQIWVQAGDLQNQKPAFIGVVADSLRSASK